MADKVSTLIFSMNRVENVAELCEKLRDYVDEIVVVDSSDKEKFDWLKEKMPFARIYWFPPIGVVELCYKVGLDLCQHDWVLHLEDDEMPSDELLKDLKKIVQEYGKEYKVFKVTRGTKERNQKLFRLFHKSEIIPTGVIHWTWASKTNKIFELDSKYFIYHPPEEKKAILKKLRKYAIIESYQYGYKVLATIYSSIFKYEKAPSIFYRVFKAIYESLQKINKKFAMLVATSLYNFYFLLYGLKSGEFLYSTYYWLMIQKELLRDFEKKFRIWLKTFEAGGPINYAGLTLENFCKSAGELDAKDGIGNFIKLMELGLK